MRRLRKSDLRRLLSFPQWLRVPCLRTVQQDNKPNLSLCGKPGVVYLVSDDRQLIFEYGTKSTMMALCPRGIGIR